MYSWIENYPSSLKYEIIFTAVPNDSLSRKRILQHTQNAFKIELREVNIDNAEQLMCV